MKQTHENKRHVISMEAFNRALGLPQRTAKPTFWTQGRKDAAALCIIGTLLVSMGVACWKLVKNTQEINKSSLINSETQQAPRPEMPARVQSQLAPPTP